MSAITAGLHGPAAAFRMPDELVRCDKRRKLHGEANSVHQKMLETLKKKGIQRIRLRW
ncbi:hypothetical protein ACP3TJ_07990 [Desulforudis sp. 1088]|uniref:hypothetical protein n=1 Tax=unclassified Candidatus Desulforudis TaxID=2635950 RepID=UPI003CF11C6B